MSEAHWDRVREVFAAVLEAGPDRRATVLETALSETPGVRQDVEALLGAHREAEGFLSRREGEGSDEPAFERIGPYRVLGELARGGMGTVHVAVRDDGEFRQAVAVKVLKRGLDTDDIVRRFHAERQTLAALEHPYTAKLLDGGSTEDGRPYLVMELIEGDPIDAFCSSRGLSQRAVLELFSKVCTAVSHAHQHLVIHRDIKPGNILVSAGPDGEPTPKLLDFGIAKLLEPGATTSNASRSLRSGGWMTPAFASPEQILGEPVSTTSDVYSLGALLYALVSGRKPHDLDQATAAEAARIVSEVEPPPPTDSGELNTICGKALRKDPQERYSSAEQLREDVRRYLANLPILARPDTVGYRVRKFLRRNALGSALAAAALVLLVGALLVIRDGARVARAEATKAQEINAFLRSILSSVDPSNQGRNVNFLEVVDGAAERIATEFEHRPEVRATLEETLGRTYHHLGRFEEARDHLITALELQRERLGFDHPSLAGALNAVGELEYDLGERESSMAHLEEALRIAERHGDSLAVARSLNVIALLHYSRGEHDRAVELQTRAIEAWRASEGIGDGIARSYNNLGLANLARRDYEGAREAFEQGLRIQRELHGRPHPDIATTLFNLGVFLQSQGDAAGAQERYAEALAIREEVLGMDHPDSALVMTRLGELLALREDPKRGAELVLRANEIQRKALGEESAGFAQSSYGLGVVLFEAGDFDGALGAFDESYAVYTALAGNRDFIWTARIRLLETLLTLGEEALVEEETSALLAELRVSGGYYAHDYVAADALALRARLQLARGEAQAALALADEAIAVRWDRLNWRGWPLKQLRAECLFDLDRVEEALEAQREAIDGYVRMLGESAPRLAWARLRLGELLLMSGDREAAEPLFEQGEQRLGEVFPGGHPGLAASRELRALFEDDP